MSYASLIDINQVTVAQVSRSHSPVFDLAVRNLQDEVYLWNVAVSTICGIFLTVNWRMATSDTNQVTVTYCLIVPTLMQAFSLMSRKNDDLRISFSHLAGLPYQI